ncbi:hypothetical protein M427DRAFT_75874 [Gonapodya prolifera JEL478]|uniref:Uncharacterized protein n=1 Tax=Gonapodya prolifera (strain JEL478) TaxID=1344416 RepID=A0A138ZY26_GONPJ|nr:hypothetical protein M427DRAFT_75874 [Gonapodya prolifera JEL478]|eukprot:KXS09175.1 hypothetical protein M427DRAFT_75874 [Gonapodya prolifera JEL478]
MTTPLTPTHHGSDVHAAQSLACTPRQTPTRAAAAQVMLLTPESLPRTAKRKIDATATETPPRSIPALALSNASSRPLATPVSPLAKLQNQPHPGTKLRPPNRLQHAPPKTPEALMVLAHSLITPQPPPTTLAHHADQTITALNVLLHAQFLVEWGEGDVSIVVANARETLIRADRLQRLANSPSGVRKAITDTGDEGKPLDAVRLERALLDMNLQWEDIERKLGEDNMQWGDHLRRIQRDSVLAKKWLPHYTPRIRIYLECVEFFLASLVVLLSKGRFAIPPPKPTNPTRCLIPQSALRGPNRDEHRETLPAPKKSVSQELFCAGGGPNGSTHDLVVRGKAWLCEDAGLACGHPGDGRVPKIVRTLGSGWARLTPERLIFESSDRQKRLLALPVTPDLEAYVGKLYFAPARTNNCALVLFDDPSSPSEAPSAAAAADDPDACITKMFMFQANSPECAQSLVTTLLGRGVKSHQAPYVDAAAQPQPQAGGC